MQEQARQVFQAFRDSMMAKSSEWKDLIADNVKLIGPLAEVEGKTAFIQVNEPFFASIQDSQVDEIVESGNYIITRISTDVMVPSGKVLRLEVNEWYEIKDNLIQSLRVYFDTAEFRNEMMNA